MTHKIFIAFFLLLFLSNYPADLTHAASSVEIDAKVDGTLKEFYSKVSSGKELAGKAKGILVFPSVFKAGVWIGGQYGEGALRVNGISENYYNIAGASFGFQFGMQSRSILLLFMTDESLNSFRNSSGWEAGVDGSVAFANLGAGGALDTHTLQLPIIGFVFDNQGLMVDVSLKGSKITKVNK